MPTIWYMLYYIVSITGKGERFGKNEANWKTETIKICNNEKLFPQQYILKYKIYQLKLMLSRMYMTVLT